jgi:hypothetical protein
MRHRAISITHVGLLLLCDVDGHSNLITRAVCTITGYSEARRKLLSNKATYEAHPWFQVAAMLCSTFLAAGPYIYI